MGCCGKAETAKEKTQLETVKENIEIEIMGSYGQDGKIRIEELINNLKKIGFIVEGTSFPLTVTMDGYSFIVKEENSGNVTIELAGPTANILEIKLVNEANNIVTNKPEEGTLGYYASFKIELTELGVINEVFYGETVISKENERYRIPVLEDGEYKIKVSYTVKGSNYQKDKIISIKDLFTKPIPLDTEQVAKTENFIKISDKIITNYNANEQIWRLFYADASNIFLITSDCVPLNKLKDQKEQLDFLDNGSYNVYWNIENLQETDILNETASKFMLNEKSKFTVSNYNYKITANLMDSISWSNFVDKVWADEAIGGATIEMWMASWNKKYPNDRLYCNKTNSSGYYVGIDTEPTTTSIDSSIMSKKRGYKDTLYYPHTSVYEKCYGYWLASPGCGGQYLQRGIFFNSIVNGQNINKDNLGIRPVVHLAPEVKIAPYGENYRLVRDGKR